MNESAAPCATPPENKAAPPSLERHRRKCAICRHPDRDEIEQQYVDWRSAAAIARRHKLDDSSLHRHLRAVGLISDRRSNLRTVLDRILERGAETPISGNTIIRAVRAYACLTDDNHWLAPERRVTYESSQSQS